MSIFWLRVAVTLYSIGLAHAILTVLRRQVQMFDLALGSFCVGVILHMVAIVERWVVTGHFPLDNFFESLSVCAFLLAVGFCIVYWRYQFTSLGIILFPLIFVMTLLASTEISVAGWTDTRVRGAWLISHIFMVMLAYASLLVMTVASIFYLIQERKLKSKSPRTGGIFDRLPPLNTLDNIITKSMGLGFVLLTLATIAGSTWAFEYGTTWIADPTIVISLATWVLTLVMVLLRTSAGWRGRKAALLALSVIGSSALTWATHSGLRYLIR